MTSQVCGHSFGLWSSNHLSAAGGSGARVFGGVAMTPQNEQSELGQNAAGQARAHHTPPSPNLGTTEKLIQTPSEAAESLSDH